ncbi:sulfite exporter TauE/SafE family protein [archaeon]|nr:MAG: sulfite exporter TauE/SafE family protein [archaeon]
MHAHIHALSTSYARQPPRAGDGFVPRQQALLWLYPRARVMKLQNKHRAPAVTTRSTVARTRADAPPEHTLPRGSPSHPCLCSCLSVAPRGMCDNVEEVYIPPVVPIILAAAAATVRGITSFGDGITFQTLWALVTAAGLLPPTSCYTLRKAVLYATVMQALTMPLQVWQARRTVRSIIAYVIVMLSVGGVCVWFGAHLLLTADVKSLRAVVGVLFLCFAASRLTSTMLKQIQRRRAGACAAPASPPPPKAPGGVDMSDLRGDDGVTVTTPTSVAAQTPDFAGALSAGHSDEAPIMVVSSSSGSGDGSTGHQPTHATRAGLADGQALSAWRRVQRTWAAGDALLPAAFHKLSPNFSRLSMVVMLILASSVSGILAGMFGTGGPPLIMVYTMLQLEKDTLRGMAMVASGYMIIRLVMYTGSTGAVFDPAHEWGTYLGIIVASLVGAQVGTRIRTFVNGELLTQLLLVLVLLSSALMLDATREPGVAAFYAVGAALWLLLAALWWKKPHLLPTCKRFRC